MLHRKLIYKQFLLLHSFRKHQWNISVLNGKTKCQQIKSLMFSNLSAFFLLSFRCTKPWGCASWTAFLHTDHSTFIHLFIFIAILMVSIRWLLTFALTAVILLPHAATAFCLVITYFNHSRPSHLSYILLAAPSCGAWSLQLHGCSFMVFLTDLGLCTLLDPRYLFLSFLFIYF